MTDIPTKDAVMKALSTVIDPEVGINIVDLGLVYEVEVPEDGAVKIKLTMTSPSCPMGPMIMEEVGDAVGRQRGVVSVALDLVWEPPWSPDMMSDAAKDHFGS